MVYVYVPRNGKTECLRGRGERTKFKKRKKKEKNLRKRTRLSCRGCPLLPCMLRRIAQLRIGDDQLPAVHREPIVKSINQPAQSPASQPAKLIAVENPTCDRRPNHADRPNPMMREKGRANHKLRQKARGNHDGMGYMCKRTKLLPVRHY